MDSTVPCHPQFLICPSVGYKTLADGVRIINSSYRQSSNLNNSNTCAWHLPGHWDLTEKYMKTTQYRSLSTAIVVYDFWSYWWGDQAFQHGLSYGGHTVGGWGRNYLYADQHVLWGGRNDFETCYGSWFAPKDALTKAHLPDYP